MTNKNHITYLDDEGVPVMRALHLLTQKKSIHVGTWNIWTVLKTGKAAIVADEMAPYATFYFWTVLKSKLQFWRLAISTFTYLVLSFQ